MTLAYIKKYYLLLSALAVSVLFAISYFRAFSDNYESDIRHFNAHFIKKEKELERALALRSKEFSDEELTDGWQEFEPAEGINIHIYRNDSLKYWNTNQLPVMRFADIHFPSEGIVHLQNGWYYAQIKQLNGYTIVGSFLIRHDFAYENKDLSNEFYGELHLPFKASINIAEDQGLAIHNESGDYLFSVIPAEMQEMGYYTSVFLMLLLLFALIVWMRLASHVRSIIKSPFKWAIPFLIIILRIVSLHFDWFRFMDGTVGFDPSIYGSDQWFPNLFGFLLNIAVLVYSINELNAFFKDKNHLQAKRFAFIPVFILSIGGYEVFIFLVKGLIDNSSIEMEIGEIFSLSILSICTVASLGVYFYSYFQFLFRLFRFAVVNGFRPSRLAAYVVLLSSLFAFYQINYGAELLSLASFPFVFYGIALYLAVLPQDSKPLATGLILLAFFAGALSFAISDFNFRKEKGEREVFANQLVTEKSIVTEVEYAMLAEKIKVDNYIQRFIGSSANIGLTDFQENLERRLFNGYWERYEMEFNLFSADHKSLLENGGSSEQQYSKYEEIIERSGEQSEVTPSIYFVKDYSDQYSYIIKEEIIGSDSTKAILFCTLKSKKIPEEIGFPRLLISSRANVLESLESYSIAKYQDDRLITKYGDFNFPSAYSIMLPGKQNPSGIFFDFGGYNHFLMKRSESEVVVLSKKNGNWVDQLTSFSYLFCFFGLLLFPMLFRLNRKDAASRTLSLAMKIQLVLFSLVFLSLLSFGWGSGIFVRNQYNEFTSDVIKEKLNSVETEVKAKLGEFDNLEINQNGDYMQMILQKFSRVFFTDINLYDTNGYLLATSRPKVFNMGLISEQINPEAFSYLEYGKKSGYVHQESIGKLNYASAYQPFYNSKGKHLGFINLQHFGQQSEFESQIQKFLVAIINVFILLLAISLILAIFISNWLTAPLRILQESFARVKFGKHNERISYNKEDEIGALVREYNQKLDELEFTAQQLARSERESAWREMAKQVAHEIKNPLTPMKLSVQQLLRSFNPEDPGSKDKLERVANSIIEQIDALTNIANEFSNFAKMPQPSEEKIEIVSLIKSVREVFSQNEEIVFNINCDPEKIFVHADKDQLIRVFNNLIKNAMQAIPGDRKGVINIMLTVVNGKVRISIADNGVGIEKSKRAKIFVPYFTTKSTGTGLGLAMVKQIVENHRGTIEFESVEDEGSTFIIEFPVAR